jgi:acyl-CoA thioesterase FadM
MGDGDKLALHPLPGRDSPIMRVTVAKPLVVYRGTVKPDWIDYNGHMTISAYLLAFGEGVDAFLAHLGIDAAMLRAEGLATKRTVSHPRYVKECFEGEPLLIEAQLLGFFPAQIHLFQFMRRGEEGPLLATEESIVSNHHLAGKSPIEQRLVRFELSVSAGLESLMALHGSLPRPDGVGSAIELHQYR